MFCHKEIIWPCSCSQVIRTYFQNLMKTQVFINFWTFFFNEFFIVNFGTKGKGKGRFILMTSASWDVVLSRLCYPCDYSLTLELFKESSSHFSLSGLARLFLSPYIHHHNLLYPSLFNRTIFFFSLAPNSTMNKSKLIDKCLIYHPK